MLAFEQDAVKENGCVKQEEKRVKDGIDADQEPEHGTDRNTGLLDAARGGFDAGLESVSGKRPRGFVFWSKDAKIPLLADLTVSSLSGYDLRLAI